MDEDDRKFLNKVLFLEPRHFSKEEIERLGFSYPPPTGWLKLARRRLNDDWNNEKDSRHLEQLLKSERNKAQKDQTKRSDKIARKAERRRRKIADRRTHVDTTGKLNGFYSNKTSFKIAGEQRLSFSSDKQFYASWEWKELRYKALQKYGAKCMLCGAAEQIVVDHIKPRSKFPSLQLEFDNMQVLCDACNKGKSNKDFTDFRPRD
jgi:5-methylcytosine-specific restriction endonuclease McrA